MVRSQVVDADMTLTSFASSRHTRFFSVCVLATALATGLGAQVRSLTDLAAAAKAANRHTLSIPVYLDHPDEFAESFEAWAKRASLLVVTATSRTPLQTVSE